MEEGIRGGIGMWRNSALRGEECSSKWKRIVTHSPAESAGEDGRRNFLYCEQCGGILRWNLMRSVEFDYRHLYSNLGRKFVNKYTYRYVGSLNSMGQCNTQPDTQTGTIL